MDLIDDILFKKRLQRGLMYFAQSALGPDKVILLISDKEAESKHHEMFKGPGSFQFISVGNFVLIKFQRDKQILQLK